jgi:hypothetical protein
MSPHKLEETMTFPRRGDRETVSANELRQLSTLDAGFLLYEVFHLSSVREV